MNDIVVQCRLTHQHCSHTCSTEDILYCYYGHVIYRVSHSTFSADDYYLHRGVAESPVTAFSIAHTSVTALLLITIIIPQMLNNCMPIIIITSNVNNVRGSVPA